MNDDRRPPDERDEEQRVPIRIRDKRVTGRDDQPPTEADLEQRALDLEEAQSLASERLDQLMRLKADFENYRKRMIREQTEMVDRASLRIVERLLPVLDDLERALTAARDQGAEGIVRGIELVHNHLVDVLRTEGLERVEADGADFDPHEHEAVSSKPGDVDGPTVLEVVRPGYRLKGKTIRPALVHVSTPRAEPEEGGE